MNYNVNSFYNFKLCIYETKTAKLSTHFVLDVIVSVH